MNPLSEALRLYQQEDYSEAVRRLREIVAEAPDNAQAWMYYGAALGQLQEWDAAVRALRQVVRLQPEQASSYCDLASALLEQGDVGSAGEAIASALLLEPAHPVALQLQERLASEEPTTERPPLPPADGQRDELAARRQAAAERFGTIGEASVVMESRYLPYLLAILAVLLLTVGVKLARRPSEPYRWLVQASQLLDETAERRREASQTVGEDFDFLADIRTSEERAERLVSAAAERLPDSPEMHYLQARLRWIRDQRALAARNELQQALALLDRSARTGWDRQELTSDVYRLRAQIGYSTAYGATRLETLQRALRDIQQAEQLHIRPGDQPLREAIQSQLPSTDQG